MTSIGKTFAEVCLLTLWANHRDSCAEPSLVSLWWSYSVVYNAHFIEDDTSKLCTSQYRSCCVKLCQLHSQTSSLDRLSESSQIRTTYYFIKELSNGGVTFIFNGFRLRPFSETLFTDDWMLETINFKKATYIDTNLLYYLCFKRYEFYLILFKLFPAYDIGRIS